MYMSFQPHCALSLSLALTLSPSLSLPLSVICSVALYSPLFISDINPVVFPKLHPALDLLISLSPSVPPPPLSPSLSLSLCPSTNVSLVLPHRFGVQSQMVLSLLLFLYGFSLHQRNQGRFEQQTLLSLTLDNRPVKSAIL